MIVLPLALLSSPVKTNMGPVFSESREGRSSSATMRLIASASYPLAFSAPIREPMLVPTMPTMGMLFCSSTSMTPMWAKPRVPPPERTSTTPASAD